MDEFDSYIDEELQKNGELGFDHFIDYLIYYFDGGTDSIEVPYKGTYVDSLQLVVSFFPKFREEFEKYLNDFVTKYKVGTDFSDEFENLVEEIENHQKAVNDIYDYRKELLDYSRETEEFDDFSLGHALELVGIKMEKDKYGLVTYFINSQGSSFVVSYEKIIMIYGGETYQGLVDDAIAKLEKRYSKFVDEERYNDFFRSLKRAQNTYPKILRV